MKAAGLPSPGERFRYALDLSVGLHLRLGLPVDVRVLNDAPLAFRYHALQGRPLVTRDETFLDELRARTWDDYLDFQPPRASRSRLEVGPPGSGGRARRETAERYLKLHLPAPEVIGDALRAVRALRQGPPD